MTRNAFITTTLYEMPNWFQLKREVMELCVLIILSYVTYVIDMSNFNIKTKENIHLREFVVF